MQIRHTSERIPEAVQSFPIAPNSDKIDREEIQIILAACVRVKATRILEVGTYRGGTTANISAFCRLHLPDAVLFTVDVRTIPSSMPKEQVGEVLPANRIGELIPLSDANRVSRRLIDPANMDDLTWAYTAGGPWDVVFLDGDHSYAGTKLAYEVVSQWMSPVGVILLHDCWWNVTPPPVDGPLRLLGELNGAIVNETHVGTVETGHAE